MSEIEIKQLLDGDEQFYPQTDLHALVNDGEYAIDDKPTIDSSNLVTSGGVVSELALGAVYDVTAHNGGATFESLSALLTDANLANLIPVNIRRGGMSIKFVCSDNKYVQYRLMSDTFNTTVANWQGVDDKPIAGSNNLVKSGGVVDFATKINGKVEFLSGYAYTTSTNTPIMVELADLCGFRIGAEHVNVGDKFLISVKGGGSLRGWCTVDKDGLIVRRSESVVDTTQNPYTLEIQSGEVDVYGNTAVDFLPKSYVTKLEASNRIDKNQKDINLNKQEISNLESILEIESPSILENAISPNPNSEGLPQPSSAGIGIGSYKFDVTNYRGRIIKIVNATLSNLGWCLQFSGEQAPSTYVGNTKFDLPANDTLEVNINEDTKYLIINFYSKEYAYIMPTQKVVTDKNLICIGDSITNGSGASRYSLNFYWKLRTALLNENIISDSYNFSSPGNSSRGIAAINGAYPLYISEDFTIPATATPVQIKVNTTIHNADHNIANGINPCYIGGIKGNIAYNDGTTYLFTREEAGTQKYITAGTNVLTKTTKYNLKSYIMTVFVGTNNLIDTYPEGLDALVTDIDSLVKLSYNGKFVVLLPYVNSTSSTFREKILEKYSQRCIDLYQYFSTRAVLDAKEQGLISEGEQSNWQTILLVDGVHPNDLGHELIYQQILNVIHELEF